MLYILQGLTIYVKQNLLKVCIVAMYYASVIHYNTYLNNHDKHTGSKFYYKNCLNATNKTLNIFLKE